MVGLRSWLLVGVLLGGITAGASIAASASRPPRLVRASKVPTSVPDVYSCHLVWAGSRTNPDRGLVRFAHHHWDYISHLSVRRMGCRRALHVMHHATLSWTNGPNLRARDFGCHGIDPGSGGGIVRCVRGTSALRLTIYT